VPGALMFDARTVSLLCEQLAGRPLTPEEMVRVQQRLDAARAKAEATAQQRH
jgi:hypothetical protein